MRLIAIFVTLLVVNVSQAQIVFAPGVTYTSNKWQNTGATVSDSKTTIFDLKLAYLHSSGLYLGGMYSSMKVGDDSAYAAGPTLGYNHYSGFYALFTYHLLAQYQRNGGSKLTDGMGAQIDFGWVFPLTSMFSLGPQITYRSLNFKKDAGATTDQTWTSINPYISLWFQF